MMEDSDEDVEAHPPRTAVLWEKCIEQSFIVDLSEDESLHFSDLEASFPVHLSQAGSAASEASLHLSGSAELSALDDSTSSECSGASSKDEEKLLKARSSNSVREQGPPPRPIRQDGAPSTRDNEDLGQNTSDEDQEDLPYDGDLGSPYFNHTSSTERNLSSDGKETPHASPELNWIVDSRDDQHIVQNLSLIEMTNHEPELRSQEASGDQAEEDLTGASKPAHLGAAPTHSRPVPAAQPPPDITQLLLRHFSREEELWCSGRLIEAETLPEVSLLESMDDTLFSMVLKNKPAGIPREDNTSSGSPTEGKYTNQSSSKGNSAETADDWSDSASEAADSLRRPQADISATEELSSAANASNSEGESEGQRLLTRETGIGVDDDVPLVRARSFSELKYGQGQVHYPLPDFSKVPSKVKIPKASTGPTTTTTTSRPTAQQPPSTMHRAQSSPGILGLISRVLEDSAQPPESPYVFPDQEKYTASVMVHHLQAEYDKLLTKYAEAENLIDEMRLGNKPQTPSEDQLELDCGVYQGLPGSHFESSAPPSPSPAVKCSEEAAYRSASEQLLVNQPSEQHPSDAERMTTELRDIITEFMEKVEEFKVNVNNTSISLADQQMMLRSMMEAQDQLQRQYISKKESHRALEMQNYIGFRRNTGTFDPDRLVEGDIFRIGMHLEDIKEMIDRNVCDQLSPPLSSSTPTSTPPMPSLGLKASHTHLSDPSPPSFQHEEPGACFPASAYELWGAAEEEVEKMEEEDQGDSELEQSREIALLTHSPEPSSPPPPPHSHTDPPHRLQSSLEGLDITAAAPADDEQEWRGVERSCSISEVKVTADASARVTGATSSSSGQMQWTPQSIFTQGDSVLSTGSEWELAASNSQAAADDDSLAANDSLATSYSSAAIERLADSYNLAASDSLAVELSSASHASETHSSCLSQRIVSPETDSGFGSSDLLQPGLGIYQSKLLTESPSAAVHPHSDGLSVSDSEDSSSNLQTAIHPPTTTDQPTRKSRGRRRSLPTTSQSESSTAGQQESISGQIQHIPTNTPGGGAASAVDQWVESTTKQRPIRRHQSRANQVQHHLSEPTLGTAMHAPQRCDRLHSCSCNSEALVALQTEVSRLKKDLEDGLVQLPHLAQKMDYLTSVQYRLDRQDRRSKPRPRGQHRKSCNSVWKPLSSKSEVWEDGGSSPLRVEDWISSDMEQSKSKGTDSGKADDSMAMLRSHSSPGGGGRGSGGSLSVCSELPRAPQGKRPAYRGDDVRRVHSKEKPCLLSPPPPPPPPLQKLLLQVNYTSSCSLPASFKVNSEPMRAAASSHRKRSVQSDSALLPSNVFFQRTPSPSPGLGCLGTGGRGSEEEEMNRTLDRAIEAARCMKRTTDRMAKSLSADLAKAQLRRKLQQNAQPLGGRRGTAL